MTRETPYNASNSAQPGLSRRSFLGRSLTAAATASTFGAALQGCGGGGEGPGPTSAQTVDVATKPPSYYPSEYKDIIEASKKEGGSLTIYSNMAVYNWQPIIDAFQQRYPWVKSIKTNNLDSSEVFQRYYNEQATGVPAADFVVSGSPQNWIDFVDRGYALEYQSPEAEKIPGWSAPRKGLYTFSTDPILMTYNKSLLEKDKRPTGIGHLAELVKANPDTFRNKIATYDVKVPFSFGFAINWNYAEETQDAWPKLETILPHVQPESSSGPMVEKLRSGEYLAGHFLSSTVVFPEVAKTGGKVLGWNYIGDGTPMFLRGMAISANAPRKNTAKLMLDFVLSHDGQAAVYRGGFTPYRSDLDKREAARTYQTVVDKVGKANVLRVDYGQVKEGEAKNFVERWQGQLQ